MVPDKERSGMGLHCLPKWLRKHFSRRQKQMTIVVIKDKMSAKHDCLSTYLAQLL